MPIQPSSRNTSCGKSDEIPSQVSNFLCGLIVMPVIVLFHHFLNQTVMRWIEDTFSSYKIFRYFSLLFEDHAEKWLKKIEILSVEGRVKKSPIFTKFVLLLSFHFPYSMLLKISKWTTIQVEGTGLPLVFLLMYDSCLF